MASSEQRPLTLDELFERSMPQLVAYVRVRMGRDLASRESALDLAQSVCREMLQDLQGVAFDGEPEFRKWLFMQANRKVVDRHRYYRRAVRDVSREQHVPAPTLDDELRAMTRICSPSRAASAREQLAMIEQAIEQLPDNQRQAIAMSRIAGLPNATIADEMETTESAIRNLIARGLARLSTLVDVD